MQNGWKNEEEPSSCGDEKDEPKFRAGDGWMVARRDWYRIETVIRGCGPFHKREVLLL